MESIQPQSAVPPRRRVGHTRVLLVGALVAGGLWTIQNRSRSPELPESIDPAPSVSESADRAESVIGKNIELASHEAIESSTDSRAIDENATETNDDRCRRQVVGEWEDDYQGHRHLKIHADGSATMLVEPSGIGRKLFAERLRFDIEWTFGDGKIVMLTTGGEPKSKTNLIINLYGTRAEYKLLDLNENQLVLLDADGKTKYEWRRVSRERRDP